MLFSYTTLFRSQRRAGTIPNRGGGRTPECWYRRRSFAAAFVYSLPDLGPGERLLQTFAVHGAVLEAEPARPLAGFAEAFAQAILNHLAQGGAAAYVQALGFGQQRIGDLDRGLHGAILPY